MIVSSLPPRSRVRLRRVLRSLGPAMPWPVRGLAIRGALGAGLALLAWGLLLELAGGGPEGMAGLVLIAPLGATAFLLFMVPNSPLAQPWSAVMGNAASALVAVAVMKIGLPPAMAAGLAVGGAILLMAALRAMHPPGGAVALTAVLLGEPDLGFVLAPVLLDTVALVVVAMAWARLTGRHYPFRQPVARPPDPTHLSTEEMAALLQRLNQSANIGTEDFARLLAAAEAEVATHGVPRRR